MNPYLNANQDVVYPMLQGTQIPFSLSIFRYIKVAADCTQCVLKHVQIRNNQLYCIFSVQLISQQKPQIIVFQAVRQNSTSLKKTKDVSMLISTGYLAQQCNVDCNIPIARTCYSQPAPNSGYKTITLGSSVYNTQSILKLDFSGGLQTATQGSTISIAYTGQRPALQLCRENIASDSYGVRSVNGISGHKLIICTDQDAGILLDYNQGNIVNTIYVKSQDKSGYGCRLQQEGI